MATENGSTALTAKLRAMYGKRLTAQNYRELLRKQNVTEIAAYLKQLPVYSETLRDINENSVHRGQLEHVIRQQLYTDYLKTLNYIGNDELKFFGFFLKRMEIDQILSCVRYFLTNNSGEYYFSLPSLVAKRARFDVSALAKVKSAEELLSILAKTPYQTILKKFDPREENSADIIMIEHEFDLYFYNYLFKSIKEQFDGATASVIRSSFGVDVDLKNITEIFRLKKYFSLRGDQIKPLMLPYYDRIKKTDLARMIDAPDVDSTLKVLADTGYSRYFEQGGFEYIEHVSEQIRYEFNKRLFAFSSASSVSVVAYLQLKKLEIDNIISIIEGVRYGLGAAEIGKVLVGATG